MPRNPGTGIYTKPYPNVVSDTTIESTVHNGEIADIETDLNTPRPIVAGGTGANNAMAARTNLQAEVAKQIVTNFDTQIWELGSFYAAPSATGGPVGGHAFIGVAIGDPVGSLVIEAYDISDGNIPHTLYTRQKDSGSWGAWVSQQTNFDSRYVNVAGDIMTGNLEIQKSGPLLTLDTLSNSEQNVIFGDKLNLHRWAIILGNTLAESGASTGSDLQILRYNNSGSVIDIPLTVSRQSGAVLHPLGTEWGTGPMRFKFTGGPNTLVWDKDLNNADRIIWELGSCPASTVLNGYQKLGSGLILQWGNVAPTAGDATVTLPIAFPGACLNAVATMYAGSQPTTTGVAAHIVSFTNSSLVLQARYILSGGTVGGATQSIFWRAIGV